MDYACSMSFVQCVGKLDTEFRCFPRRESLAREPFTEAGSLHEVTHDIDPILLPTHFVNANDMGMLDLSGSPSFPKELLGLGIVQMLLPWDLYGNGTIQLCVAGLPDTPKTPDANLLDQLELSDCLDTSGVVRSRGLDPEQTEMTPARRTLNVLKSGVFRQLSGVVTVRTPNA
jgi:hypothetical protein